MTMADVDVFEGARRLLDGLGATGDEVAATLANKGILGDKFGSDSCPLAVLLHEQFPEIEWRVGGYALSGPDKNWHVELPAACKEFVPHFDQGYYPELERGGSRT